MSKHLVGNFLLCIDVIDVIWRDLNAIHLGEVHESRHVELKRPIAVIAIRIDYFNCSAALALTPLKSIHPNLLVIGRLRCWCNYFDCIGLRRHDPNDKSR